MEQLKEIVSYFDLRGAVCEILPLGSGLINDSYKVTTAGKENPDYVLQRINHSIFRDVELLQKNIRTVTTHIRRKLSECGQEDIDRKVLTLVSTRQGKDYFYDGTDYWRMTLFIPRAQTYETVNPEFSYHAGVAFGHFQAMLADLPEPLGETIPGFHNMEFRLHQFREAVQENRAQRLPDAEVYVAELEKRAQEMCKAEEMYRGGRLPKRVCHCDTKVNNMLFDEEGRVLCVIDLDTVMPSFIFSDYGDFLRTAANTGEEDDRYLERIGFDMEIFRAFTKGYLESARSFLTPVEIDLLPYAATLFPYMQCVRFLTDYLNGDTYYKIRYPEHNWVRTQAQFRLLESAESCLPQMEKYIRTCLEEE